MEQQLMIYGAAGYAGGLMVREAVHQGLKPIIAGRQKDAPKIERLAQEFGLRTRYFTIEQAHEHLEHIAVLLNCAGPFSATTHVLVEACLARRVHYLDITGEAQVFKHCHSLHQRAQAQGVIVLPGVGFDVVPTDCLAAMLKQALPDATRIDLAFSFDTMPSIGTAKTMVEGFGNGGLIRENHQLKIVGNAHAQRKIPFQNAEKWAVSIPWGDVFTSGISTQVPNGMVYMALPKILITLMKWSNPFRKILGSAGAQFILKKTLDVLASSGPDATARDQQRCQFWGEAKNANGQTVALTLSAPNVYTLTSQAGIQIAAYCLSGHNAGGFYTPSMLLGGDFIRTLPEIEIRQL